MKLGLIIAGGIVVLPLAAVTLYGVSRTQKVENDARQKVFAAGRLPEAPDGLYRGSLQGREVPWKGKKFQAESQTGINVFVNKEGATEERYPFRTYVGTGMKDKKLKVLKIDYGLEGNPWWLRRIVDEVVEVAPGELLGKVHVKWILGISFTMDFFRLEGTAAPVSAPAAPDESEASPPPAD